MAATRDVDVWAGRAGRFGLACRGVIYLVVSLLAVRLVQRRNAEADQRGALEDIAHHPFGRVVVLAIAAGFVGLSVWQAWWAVRARRAEPQKRVVASLKAAGYLALAGLAGAIALSGPGSGAGTGKSSDQQTSDATATVLRHSFGQFLVAAAGIGLCVVGLFLLWKALHRGFDVEVEVAAIPARVRRPVEILGSVGMAARAVVVLLIGVFLVVAAVTFDPNKAKGVDGALRSVIKAPLGPFLLIALAAGLVAFGCFSLVEARYVDTSDA